MGAMCLNRSSSTLHAISDIQSYAEQVKHLFLALKGNLVPDLVEEEWFEGYRTTIVMLGLGADLADRIFQEAGRIPKTLS